MNEFRITIHGEAIAKGRPKFSVVGGRPIARTPAKTRRYEDIVRQTAVRQWNGAPVLKDVALSVRATFFRAIPASWPRKRREAALLGECRPISRPDTDNLFKSVVDGLSGVLFHDDSQIVDVSCAKYFGLEPRVDIVVTWSAA